jgi:hypothetical protein
MDISELMRKRVVVPDLSWFEQAVNYTPPDNKPWQSVIKNLESEWHPWHTTAPFLPERVPGEPERTMEDNSGYQKAQQQVDLTKVARLAMMTTKTTADLLSKLASKFDMDTLKGHKSLLVSALKSWGLEGHVFVDPELFGSCRRAKEFLVKAKLDPDFVWRKEGYNCLCGGKDRCSVIQKPVVSKIILDKAVLKSALRKAIYRGDISADEAQRIALSTDKLSNKIKRASLSFSTEPEITQYKGTEVAAPTVVGNDDASGIYVIEGMTKALTKGYNLYKVHFAATTRVGECVATELLGHAVKRVGFIRVADLDAQCHLPNGLSSIDFKLETYPDRCYTCANYRESFCQKLRKQFVGREISQNVEAKPVADVAVYGIASPEIVLADSDLPSIPTYSTPDFGGGIAQLQAIDYLDEHSESD